MLKNHFLLSILEGLCGEALLEVGPTGERPQLSSCTDGQGEQRRPSHCEFSLAAVWRVVMTVIQLLWVSSFKCRHGKQMFSNAEHTGRLKGQGQV